MKLTKSFTLSNLGDWLVQNHDRKHEVWLSDAKKPGTVDRRWQLLIEEVRAGKPTSMH